MSVYYTMKEHLIIRDTEEGCEPLSVMEYELGILGALMLVDSVYHCKMQLIADGKELTFNGVCPDADYKNLLHTMSEAREIDFKIMYEYYWSTGSTISVLLGKMVMAEYFSELIKEAQIPKSVFYSLYNSADCGEGVGKLIAFGHKDGKYYTGDVPHQVLDTFPDDGIWYTPRTAVVYEVETTDSMDLNRINQICTELCTLSRQNDLNVDEKEVYFFLNNLVIHNRKDFDKYVSLLQQLVDLTDGECIYEEGYVNMEGDDARIILLSIEPNCTPTAEIMEL